MSLEDELFEDAAILDAYDAYTTQAKRKHVPIVKYDF